MANPLLWISAIASLLYFATQWHPVPGGIILKGLSVAALALAAFRSELSKRDRLLLTLALAFGSLGDVLIEYSFPAGLGAFLVGHFLYLSLFLTNRPRPSRLSNFDGAIIAVLGVFASFMSFYLLPATGPLAPAVAIYMGAIAGMAAAAAALQLPKRWVMSGALLFLMSDTILAISKFKQPVPAREFMVWPTYYLGQSLILLGYLEAQNGKRIALSNSERMVDANESLH